VLKKENHMKLLQAAFAAVLTVSSMGISGVAAAQGMHQGQGHGDHARSESMNRDDRVDSRDRVDRDDRRDRADRYNRNEHRGYNDNRGRHLGWRNNARRQVCRTEWRNHHRQRVCRWVRR
jgi:hypothetical protein